MEQIILDIINKFNYLGIAFLIAIENLFPPIPSEVILTSAGFATTVEGVNMTFVGVVIASTIGAIIGATLLYLIGYILNADRVAILFESKLAKVLRLKTNDLHKAEAWFNKYETKAVFIGRFIPIVRSLVSIPAGMAKMKFIPFITLTTIGTFIWNIVLVYLGILAGNNYHVVANYFDLYSNIALIIIIIVILVLIALFVKSRFFSKENK